MPERFAPTHRSPITMTYRRDSRQKLGELLAARGKLDRAMLLEALRMQRVHGGRLGTCLLELDAVREDDLLDVLSDQLKLPFLAADDLRAIPEEVLRLVPAKVALARGAVPVRASGTQLTMAMSEPHDLAGLDEIAFVSGRRIRPHTALEVRIQEALARSYRADIPTRFVKLLDRLNRARFMWKAEEAGEAAPPDQWAAPTPSALPGPPTPYPPLPPRPGERPAPPSLASTPVRSEPEISAPPLPPPPALASAPPLLPDSAPPPAASVAPAPPSPPARVVEPAPAAATPEPSAAGFEAIALRLQAPGDRDEVADALVDFLRPRADVALVMMIRAGEAAGWRAHGVAARAVTDLRVDLGEPSLVHALRDGAPLHRGLLSPLSGNEPLRAWLGAPLADVLALPLRVRDRTVGLVLAAARRAPLAVDLVEELRRLAPLASTALELLVLQRKLRRT